MFQNLKAKELDVIITRKEEKIRLEVAVRKKESSNITARRCLWQIKDYGTLEKKAKEKWQILEQFI